MPKSNALGTYATTKLIFHGVTLLFSPAAIRENCQRQCNNGWGLHTAIKNGSLLAARLKGPPTKKCIFLLAVHFSDFCWRLKRTAILKDQLSPPHLTLYSLSFPIGSHSFPTLLLLLPCRCPPACTPPPPPSSFPTGARRAHLSSSFPTGAHPSPPPSPPMDPAATSQVGGGSGDGESSVRWIRRWRISRVTAWWSQGGEVGGSKAADGASVAAPHSSSPPKSGRRGRLPHSLPSPPSF